MPTEHTKTKVSVSLSQPVVHEVDALIQAGHYATRSAAFEEALKTLLRKQMDARIAAELAKLDLAQEMVEAEEGMDDYAVLIAES